MGEAVRVPDRTRAERLVESHWRPVGAGAPERRTVAELLASAVERRPDATALVDGVADPDRRTRWTYRQAEQRSRRVAAVLLQRFDPGDHVALWAPNSADWWFLQMGAGLAGIVLVTVNPAYQHGELAHVLEQSRARGLFHARRHRGRDLERIARDAARSVPSVETLVPLDELMTAADAASAGELPPVTPDTVAQIQYTSGTTGTPKGAMLTHGGISAAYAQAMRRAGHDDAPLVWLNAMPLFHIGGAGLATIGTLSRAGTQVVMPEFDVGLFLELAATERATITLAVPTMLIALLEHPGLADADPASLRTILTGGATVPQELVLWVQRELDARVLITFGQTEAHGTMCMTRPDDTPADISTTVGVPLDHVEVQVVDPVSRRVVPIGTSGEIVVRGHQVMAGYFDRPDDTAAAIDDEGWLRFGDLGVMDERGYLSVIGRLKEMVIRGGENVYPREVEEALLGHPAVADAAVVGVPDPIWGEEVAAVVRRAAGTDADPAALFAFCRERLAGYKAPRLWFFVDAFPTTPSGKVQKHRLARMIADGDLDLAATFAHKPGGPAAAARTGPPAHRPSTGGA